MSGSSTLILARRRVARLHGIDENNASEVAELLAYIRSLQRQLDVSVTWCITREERPGLLVVGGHRERSSNHQTNACK